MRLEWFSAGGSLWSLGLIFKPAATEKKLPHADTEGASQINFLWCLEFYLATDVANLEDGDDFIASQRKTFPRGGSSVGRTTKRLIATSSFGRTLRKTCKTFGGGDRFHKTFAGKKKKKKSPETQMTFVSRCLERSSPLTFHQNCNQNNVWCVTINNSPGG